MAVSNIVGQNIQRREANRLRIFENRVQNKAFESQKNEVPVGWEIRYNEGVHGLCLSLNVISFTKTKRTKQVRYLAYMGEKFIGCMMRKPEGKHPLKKRKCSGGLILKRLLKN